jgi:hypothetical protein
MSLDPILVLHSEMLVPMTGNNLIPCCTRKPAACVCVCVCVRVHVMLALVVMCMCLHVLDAG